MDAKEPAAGSLGPVIGGMSFARSLALPPGMPLSVALGDAALADELADVLDHVATRCARAGPSSKSDLPECRGREQVAAGLRRAVDRARDLGPTVAVIAASYADCDRARSLSPEGILDAAIGAGAAGALIDTWIKDGRGLLRHMSVDALAAWILRARSAGLLTALAGSLTADDLPILWDLQPDVVGVRGAACRHGRAGILDPHRLHRLRATLDRVASSASRPLSGGELPEPGARILPLPR